MTADILVMKKKGNKVSINIRQQIRKGYTPDSYSVVVNLQNYKDIALFLHDLEDLQGAPILKAIQEYLGGKQKTWPF